ncbi:hypothetical protein SEA_KARDASHIAN_73 [Streptomyces phage Kardashian]|nr:hypothetical protein SEA_KARDASHIAN_73 [Streptomyces phage Kardashian]
MRLLYSVTKHDDPDTEIFKGDKDEVLNWLLVQNSVSYLVITKVGGSLGYTPSQFLTNVVNVVPKFYVMDSKNEDLLPSGMHLANGMRVLAGDPSDRERPEEANADWSIDKVMIQNRWCVVTNLKIIGEQITFIGVYDDGTKRKRRYSANKTWLVRLTSIAKSRIEDTQRYKDVYEIVKGALVANEEELGFGVDNVAKTATKKILGSIG